MKDTEDLELKPQIVMRDSETKFTVLFDNLSQSSGTQIKRNTLRSPNLRAHVERFLQTFQVECLNKFVIVGTRQLNHIGMKFMLHYNRQQPHSTPDGLPPDTVEEPAVIGTINQRKVTYDTRLRGVLLMYERRAA